MWNFCEKTSNVLIKDGDDTKNNQKGEYIRVHFGKNRVILCELHGNVKEDINLQK